MDTKSTNRLNMLILTINYCLATSSQTAGITAFAPELADIVALRDIILNYLNIAQTPTQGVTANTTVKRATAQSQAYVVSKGLYSFASATPVDPILQEETYLTKSTLQAMKKLTAYAKATYIYNTAFDHSADIIPYGITGPDLVALQNANDDYFDVLEAPKNAINNRKNAKNEAKGFLNTAILTNLADNLDPMAETLLLSNPAWFQAYRSSREIQDLGTSKSYIAATFLTGVSPVPGVKITIVNKQHIQPPALPKTYDPAYSDLDGKTLATTKGSGLFDVTAQKTGYPTQKFTDIRVKRGQTMHLGTIQFPPNPILSDSVNPLEAKPTPNLPQGTPTPIPSTRIKILCLVLNATLEFWFTTDDDTSGNPAGRPVTTVTLAQLFNATVGLMGFSTTTPKLMVRNTGTVAGTYSMEITFA